MGLTRNLRDGQIKIKDGSTNSTTLVLEQGDLKWSQKQNVLDILDRGVLDHARMGDQAAVALSFTIMVDRVYEATTNPTPYNCFLRIGAASAWTSVGATHEVFMLKVEFTVLDPASGGSDHEVITFNKVYHTSLDYTEGDKANTLAFTGVDFEVKPTIT